MCGIAGVISWDDKYRVTRETLARMSARIAHRGPDGEGFYLNHEREVTPENPQCGFAFRRLAILDPDPRAMQPFTIGDKTIVFNGEIYNFRELRAELTKLRPEYEWRTTGDTEVLLLAYVCWGERCLERLNGMFALAVWNERNQELFLARDRMGQKPLFYAMAGKWQEESRQSAAVAFASELSALTALGWVSKEVDGRALYEYLRWGYVPDPTTIYQGVRKLWPAARLRVSREQSLGVRYFDRADPNAATGARRAFAGDARAETRRLVTQATRRQLVADVPLGCFLSGGVDSSVIAAAMRASRPDGAPVLTFSIGFDDPRYDETRQALAVARHLGTRHESFVVRPDAAADLPRLAKVFGEPFADSSALPTHYLAQQTARHVKVALSGDGGDELFGGYDRYRAMALANRFARLGVLAKAARVLPGSHPKSVSARLKRFAESVRDPPAERYVAYMSLFESALLQRVFPNADTSPQGAREPVTVAQSFNALDGERDPVRAAMSCDLLTYLPDDILTKVDRASMLHGLEVRSPFMDHELVQFAAGLTTDQLLKGGPKRMLREAFADDLPAWVFKRKKMGFAVPIGEWFRGELRPMLRDNLFASDAFGRQHFDMQVVERLVEEHEREAVDHSQRLYALLMLELWWRTSR